MTRLARQPGGLYPTDIPHKHLSTNVIIANLNVNFNIFYTDYLFFRVLLQDIRCPFPHSFFTNYLQFIHTPASQSVYASSYGHPAGFSFSVAKWS